MVDSLGFSFKHVKFEMLSRHPCVDVKWAVASEGRNVLSLMNLPALFVDSVNQVINSEQ